VFFLRLSFCMLVTSLRVHCVSILYIIPTPSAPRLGRVYKPLTIEWGEIKVVYAHRG
jgi:hypothetical protein